MTAKNVYFELTREFNANGPIAVLASGQAVVFYRLAIMSKDGDWILRETPEACARVLDVLGRRGGRYRAGAPLDVRWLAGGWSSHFEHADAVGRRIRCDFFSRAPRVGPGAIDDLFREGGDPLAVIGLESLIRMKRTQRAKDYAVIAELAKLLPPEREIEATTDPDRLIELAARFGQRSARPSVVAARAARGRDAVVVELAREIDRDRRLDHDRVERFQRAAEDYRREFQRQGVSDRPLSEAHPLACDIAARLLPRTVD